jgi:hypothetical protein
VSVFRQAGGSRVLHCAPWVVTLDLGIRGEHAVSALAMRHQAPEPAPTGAR